MNQKNKKEKIKTQEPKKLLCPKACVLNQLDDDRLALSHERTLFLSFSIKLI